MIGTKKILYISDYPLNSRSGHGNMINMHRMILKEIFGENMFEIYANGREKLYGKNKRVYTANNSLIKAFAILKNNPPYISYRMEKFIFEFLKNNEVQYVFIENSVSGYLISRIKKFDSKIKIVAYFPDIEKQLMGEQVKNARFFRKISLMKMIENEGITAKYSDYQIVLNTRDFELYKKYYGSEPSNIIPVIVPIPQNVNNTMHHPNDPLDILFVGVDYYPNVYGVNWFIREVLPLLEIDYIFKIVGYNMEKYKDEWEQYGNIRVIGTVDLISEYYNVADVVVAPIFEGGGMKVKTAEALSYGKIVIGTKESTFGYWDFADEHINRDIYKCDTAEEFAKELNRMGRAYYKKTSVEISNWMNEEYSIKSNVRRMKTIFNAEM